MQNILKPSLFGMKMLILFISALATNVSTLINLKKANKKARAVDRRRDLQDNKLSLVVR